MRALLLLGALVVAGATGAVLTLADVGSPATGPLTLVFVLLTPAVCVGSLLGGLDLPARAIVSGAASVALAASIAEVMLVTSGWSSDGGIIATAIACVLLAGVALLLRWRGRSAKVAEMPPEEPALET